MSDINTYLKNAAVASNGLNPVPTNTPGQYASRQRQYFDPETRAFTMKTAQYSSDFMEAQVQGLDENDPTEWGTYRIRFADVVRPSSVIQRHFDDYKQFLFESYHIEYVRPGTKIQTMGSTWLVINPANISGASGSGLCRRCNAVWNFLDYYGNVVSEPIIVENARANANDSDAQNSQLISKGYFNITCQYNDYTRQIDTNTRLILGTAAYRVTGYSDFEQEFTGDYSTVRLLSFSARYEEPNDAIDDMENHVASGKIFAWDVGVSGPSSMTVGSTAQIDAQSVRNGEIVVSTVQNPIGYTWESSDEAVLTVGENGLVEAIGEGTATIRVKLAQNPQWHTNYAIEVTESEDGVKFTTSPSYALGYGIEDVLTAAYFDDGVEQDVPLNWTFAGADENAYAAIIDQNGKSATVTCYGYSDAPLTVTVSYGTYSATTNIILEGI